MAEMGRLVGVIMPESQWQELATVWMQSSSEAPRAAILRRLCQVEDVKRLEARVRNGRRWVQVLRDAAEN